MNFLKFMVVLLLSALIFFSNGTSTQADSIQQETKTTQYAIGYEVAFPLCYGLTLTYDIDPSLAIQGLITMSPQPIMLSTIKVLYKLKQDIIQPRKNSVYIYVLAGQFEDSDVWNFKKRVRGYSVGIGTEFTPKAYPENLKNYLEVGFIHFDSSDDEPSLTLSAGVKVCY
jgi:hypothetical protein